MSKELLQHTAHTCDRKDRRGLSSSPVRPDCGTPAIVDNFLGELPCSPVRFLPWEPLSVSSDRPGTLIPVVRPVGSAPQFLRSGYASHLPGVQPLAPTPQPRPPVPRGSVPGSRPLLRFHPESGPFPDQSICSSFSNEASFVATSSAISSDLIRFRASARVRPLATSAQGRAPWSPGRAR